MKMGFLKKLKEKLSEDEKNIDLPSMKNPTKEKSLPSFIAKTNDTLKLEPIPLNGKVRFLRS